jgi:hypothetical protein
VKVCLQTKELKKECADACLGHQQIFTGGDSGAEEIQVAKESSQAKE